MDLAIRNKKVSIDLILSLFFLFLVYFDMNSPGSAYWKIIVVGLIFLNVCLKYKSLSFNKILLLYIMFYILNIASGLYGMSNEYFVGNFLIITSLLMMLLSFPKIFNTKQKIQFFLQATILFGVILSIYAISLTDISRLMRGVYYAENILLEHIGNRNDVAMTIGLSFNLSMYFYLHKKRKINLIFMLIMIIAILLTGSRKGLLFCVLPFFINIGYIFFTTKKIKSKLRYLLILLVLVGSVYYALFHIEFLYNNIGFRIENMLRSIFLNQETSDLSLNSRGNMIDAGLEFFGKKPLLGYGLENFRFLYSHETGIETYSHNNYVELLVNNGLIGFLSYYLFILLIIFRNIINTKISEEKNYYILLISLLISIMIIDFTMISYKWYPLYLIIALSLSKFEKNDIYNQLKN